MSASIGASERTRLDAKVRGWEWIASEFARVRAQVVAERERLVGPERGE